jgi:hypothetical protein
MAKLRHTLQHGLALEDARKLALEAWEHYRVLLARNQPELEMQGPDSAVVKWVSRLGNRYQCSVELRDQVAVLEMDIPLLARPFKDIGIAMIEKELSGWLAKHASRRPPG